MKQETLLKIVGLMRKDLNNGFTILEISRKLKIGYRPAYMHISGMEGEGIIKIKRAGMAKQCFLDIGNAKCRRLLEDVDMVAKDVITAKNPRLKSVLDGIVSKIGEIFASDLHSVVLFGSYAKMNAVKASDVDLLFIVADMKKENVRAGIERECASYQYSHKLTVSPLISDVVEFKKMLNSNEINVGKEIKEYGIPLYGSEMFWRIIGKIEEVLST